MQTIAGKSYYDHYTSFQIYSQLKELAAPPDKLPNLIIKIRIRGGKKPVREAIWFSLNNLLHDLAARLFLQNDLLLAVWHDFFFDQEMLASYSAGRSSSRPASPPRHTSSCTGSHCLLVGRAVSGVHDGVDHVAVVEGLPSAALAGVHRVEHIHEHLHIAQRADFVADREQPAGVALGLFGHVAALADGR